ncbi:MAG: transglutaminaseTgpA domain-containing protein [Dehalococcoidia bacterium]
MGRVARYGLSSRSLAFLAICCAIAAVAWVGNDPLLFLVGSSGLAAGNVYMWRTRYATSRVRTAVLLLLLIILLAYLGRDMVFSRTGDQLLLARYLVYGLIVNSFDLRTRRNVMGTLLLAGMLFILLSPMAFTLWFAVLMGTFVLLALGAATAGHIEEEAGQTIVAGGRNGLSPGRALVGLIATFLVLSAAFFLLMPRFGLGGLTQASWLPSRIDFIAGAPGGLPSRPSAAVSPDILASQLPGTAGAGRHVSLGYVGSAADIPVLHVRSRVSSYWRGSTLDTYDGAGWLPTVMRLAVVDEGRGEFLFPDAKIGGPRPRWYSQTYYLIAGQPNAVFTGYNPGRVFLPQTTQIYLQAGTVYRVVSTLPRLSPGDLRSDSVDSTDLANLALPPISERTAALTESIVEGAPTDYDKAVRLEQFLLRNYPYDLNVEPLTPGRDAVDVFLFEQQAGYCAHFATAMAVMARHAGLPARVAIGYLPGVYNPMTGAYTVRRGDAHSWVEIHFDKAGWVAFDPTPRPDAALASGTGPGWVSFGLLDVAGLSFGGAFSTLSGDWSLGRLSLPGWFWLAVPGILALAVFIATLLLSRRRAKGTRDHDGYTSLTGIPRQTVLRAYGRTVALLVRKGLPTRQSAQTPREYTRLVAPRLTGGLDIVQWMSESATAAAYDPRPINPSTAQEAMEKLAALGRTLAVRAG